ncbi:acetate--CoA ligase family protein [Myxococcota bacterium]|nr:acetate--CoA ligase family protein [Myxococcota bacterium]
MSHPLDALLRPRSVAVIGASRERNSISYDLLHNLLEFGFTGPVFPVNPRTPVVHSLKCYPSVSDIPDPVDLAIIVVPRQHVLAHAEACARKGVKGLVVITAGFKEVGGEGEVLEQKLREITRNAGMRMVGPNCMGLINTDPEFRLQGSFSATMVPLSGPIAFSSQSGALGEAILALMTQLGLGLSMFVSLGNKTDVSGNDLLEYWEHDPRTKVVLMYLESFGNPQRFMNTARRVARKKPILAMKSGRTAAGARAAASHTGSLAGADVAVDSLMAQCGVIRCEAIEQMFMFAAALATQPPPKGDRVAVVTNSGGPGILAVDACVRLGLQVPALSAATQARMRPALPPEASTANPVDMIASARGEHYQACLRAVVDDPDIDAVIVIFTSLEIIDSMAVADGILNGIAGTDKPVLVCFMGKVATKPAIARMKEAGLPVYTFPEEAAQAMGALYRRRVWLERPESPVAPFDDLDRGTIEGVIAEVRAAGRTTLTLVEATRVVAAAGVPVAPWAAADGWEDAAHAADRLGYPVALKLSSAVVTHKSDVGGVRLGLRDADAVRGAAVAMLSSARALDPEATLVVQRMVGGGTEVIFGASVDPKFGPLLMFGLGGIFVEILKDVSFRVAPLSEADAEDMLAEIKGAPILSGARGYPAVDRVILREVLQRLNHLLTSFPDIAELDLNPFFAAPDRERSLAADARVALRPVT